MFSVFKHKMGKVVVNYISKQIKINLPKGIAITTDRFTAKNPNCRIQLEEFGLRYNILSKDNTNNIFPSDHYCIDENRFQDELDFCPSTVHINVWKDDTIVATSRYVDGNSECFEMENFNWYQLRKKHPDIGNNIIEPCRVVASKSIRGSSLVPLMFVRASLHVVLCGFDSYIGMINVKAVPLISHYNKWVKWDLLVNEDNAFETPEYIPGNKCIVIKTDITNKSGCSTDFIFTNLLPAYVIYRIMSLHDLYKLRTGKRIHN